MFAKASLYFLLFAALVSTGLAFPKGDHEDGSSEVQHHSTGDEGHDHHHHHDHGDKEHKQKGDECHHHHGDHWDIKLNPDSPFMKVKNLSNALYTEIFIIASGDNYASPKLADDVHVSARTIVLMSQTLYDMVSVYRKIFNATTTYALKGVSIDVEETMASLINELAAQVKGYTSGRFDTAKSSVTNPLNKSFIARGKYFKSGATPQEKAEAYDKWMYDPLVGAAAMNKLFYRAVWKDDKPQYQLLGAMLDYVKHVKDDEKEKLEKIYASATAKTVQTVCPAHNQHEAALVFYENLMELLSKDADLLIKLYSDRNNSPPGMIFDTPF